jgi:hypothetical protein
MFEIICDAAMHGIVRLRTLSQQNMLTLANRIDIENNHGETPWDYAILSQTVASSTGKNPR